MMSDDDRSRDADETTFDKFMALSEGDEFGSGGSDWIVEKVDDDARNVHRLIIAAKKGAEHEWGKFTADAAALTVSAEIHDEAHENHPEMNPHSAISITFYDSESEDTEDEDDTEDSDDDPEPTTDADVDTDELKELTKEALTDVDQKGPGTMGHSVSTYVKDGEVRVKARNSSAYARASVTRAEREALDDAGIHWHFKEDRRFRDDRNPSVVIITGVKRDDVETDGGVDVSELEELETGDDLTFKINHETTGRVRELTGTVADHPYMDAHDDWMVVLEDVKRNTPGYSAVQRGHYVIYQDGSVESRPCASRQIHIGDIRSVVTSISEDPGPTDEGEQKRIQWCDECRSRVTEPMDADNGGSICPDCGHNTDTRWIQVESDDSEGPEPTDGGREVRADGGEDVDPNAGVDTEQWGEIHVLGLEPCGNERGPYGDADPYEEYLTVTVDGDEHHIPVTGVRRAAFDFRGDVPERVDMDRVFRDGDELHAESELPDGSVVEMVRAGVRDSWTLEHITNPSGEFVSVWTRDSDGDPEPEDSGE